MLVLLPGPLSELHGHLFEPSQLSALAKERFDWEISANAVEYFIPKMRSLGWLDSRTEFPARGPLWVTLPEPEEEGEGEIDTREALIDLGQQFQARGCCNNRSTGSTSDWFLCKCSNNYPHRQRISRRGSSRHARCGLVE